jgi:hypothetical protein
LNHGLRHWRLHAAASAVSFTLLIWFLAGRTDPFHAPWIALPGGFHLAAACAAPRYAERAGHAIDRIAQRIRLILSAVVLAILHLAVVSPTGIFLRICRHDPLQRLPSSSARTNWHAAPPFNDTRRMY